MKGYTVLLFGLLALFYISASEGFSVKFVAEDEEGSGAQRTSGHGTTSELKKSDNSDGLVKSANGDNKTVITSAKGGAAERASEDSASNNKSSKSSDKSRQKRDTRSMYRNQSYMKSAKRAEEAYKENMIRVLEKLAVEAARLAGASTRSAQNNLAVENAERSSSSNNPGMTSDRLDALISALAVVDAMKAANTEDIRKSVRDNSVEIVPSTLIHGDPDDCDFFPPEICFPPPPPVWIEHNTVSDPMFKRDSTRGREYLPGKPSRPGVKVDGSDSTLPLPVPDSPPVIATLPLPVPDGPPVIATLPLPVPARPLVGDPDDCDLFPPPICLPPLSPVWIEHDTVSDPMFKRDSTRGREYLPGKPSRPGVKVDGSDSTLPLPVPDSPPVIATLPLPVPDGPPVIAIPLPVPDSLPDIPNGPIILGSDSPQVMTPVVTSKDLYAGVIDLLLQEMYGKLDGQVPIPGSLDSESGPPKDLRGRSQALLHIFSILSSLGDRSRSAQG